MGFSFLSFAYPSFIFFPFSSLLHFPFSFFDISTNSGWFYFGFLFHPLPFLCFP